MTSILKTYLIALPVFLMFDGIWLGIIAKKFYFEQMKPIARVAGDGFAPIWASATRATGAAGSGSSGGLGLMPLGRPVVPEE